MASQGDNSGDTGSSLTSPASSPLTPEPQTAPAPAATPKKVESPRDRAVQASFTRFDKRDSPPRGGDGKVTLTREAARLQVALRLIWVLSGTIVILAALLASSRWTNLAPSDTTTTFNTIITAIVTLIASAVGFYFGSEDKKGNGNTRNGDDDG